MRNNKKNSIIFGGISSIDLCLAMSMEMTLEQIGELQVNFMKLFFKFDQNLKSLQ